MAVHHPPRMSKPRPPLASSDLDRDARIRTNPEAIAAAWAEPGARMLRLRGVQVPVIGDVDGPLQLALTPVEGEFSQVPNGVTSGHCYLGRKAGVPVFAEKFAEKSDEESAQRAGETSGASIGVPGAEWQHPYDVAMRLEEVDRELLTVASALLRWHETAAFSTRDGESTHPAWGGWARHDAHGGEHFPRTDPAVIVLVEHEGRVLLGSNVLWESGRFSLLAGFIEAGESAEQTVVREIYEEAGIRVGEVEYVTSQPWPFPRSLMMGFRARLAEGVAPEDISADPEEIAELRWFTRDEVRTPPPGILLPHSVSIARWLLDQWVDERETGGVER